MKCECGFWDRDRPHSRVGGGVCEYAFRRKYAVDNTGDIAIPDEVVDLKLLLECRHERNVLQKICAERSNEIDRLRAEVEALKRRELFLPKITDEMVDMFYPWLIQDDPNYTYIWNQAAVDFFCVLKEAFLRGEGGK